MPKNLEPKIGKGTKFILAQPFLGDTVEELSKKGAEQILAPFPFGAVGTTAWLKAVAEKFNVCEDIFESVIAAPKARAEKAIGIAKIFTLKFA